MKRRSKKVAAIVVVAVVAILAATGVVYRRQINLQWRVWRLRSDLEGMPPREAVRLLIQQFPDDEEAGLILGSSLPFLPRMWPTYSPEDVENRQLVQAVSVYGIAAVPDLIECLDSEKTIYAKGCLGLLGNDAIPMLIQASTDRRLSVRQQSVQVLGYVGYGSKVVVDALIRALGDEDWYVRQCAAIGLAQAALNSRPLAIVAIQALKVTLKDPNPDVRHAAGVVSEVLSSSARRKR